MSKQVGKRSNKKKTRKETISLDKYVLAFANLKIV